MKHYEGKLEVDGRLSIYWHSKITDSPKAHVLLLHGLCEHSGRYRHVMQHLAAQDYNVYSYDHRGHGKSGGLSVHVRKFEDYLRDLDQVLHFFQSTAEILPWFVLGHSMGGLIACLYASRYRPELAGLILSGAAIKVNDEISPFLIRVSAVLGTLLPKLPTLRIDLDSLSRDPSVKSSALADPLHYKGGVRAGQAAELIKASRWMETHLKEITSPLLILQGAEDRLVNPGSATLLHDQSSSGDKTLIIYKDAFHEILNETNKEDVLDDITSWLDKHVYGL
jgi:lysophospholipase